MKKIVAVALVAASLVAFPAITPTLAVDTSISALCGPDGAESYKRPGGYCDQVGSNNSLVESQEARCYGGVVSWLMADDCYHGELPL